MLFSIDVSNSLLNYLSNTVAPLESRLKNIDVKMVILWVLLKSRAWRCGTHVCVCVHINRMCALFFPQMLA